jgi:glycosyltransferase involved in cell wall biosynthesis
MIHKSELIDSERLNMGISVVIIVKNGGTILADCLESLRSFDNVVVYNNGSTDDTALIASQYSNVQLIDGCFTGFGPTKNAAAHYAANDWILSLDADEVMNEAIIDEIHSLSYDSHTVYSLLRKNFYKKSEIRHCWGEDEIVRIYNRKITSYTDKQVHEHIMTDGVSIDKLRHSFSHYPYQNISEFILKADRYSSLFAQDNVGKKRSSPTKAFFNGLYSFFRTYLLKRGFLDGYAGLIIAFSHMATNFYKYIKLYEMNLEHKDKNGK